MLSGIPLVGIFSLCLASAMVLAQDTRCRDPYLDNSIADDQRAEMLLDSAGACVREGRSLQSIALFSELIGLAPQNPTAYLNRGSSYLQIGQFELGIADLNHVMRLKPAKPNRGTAFIAIHQYDRG